MSNIKTFLSELRTLGIDEEFNDEGREALSSYCKYILSSSEKKTYSDLYQFLTWFGNEYIGPKVIDCIQELRTTFNIGTIYDMGCGTGWLGHSISTETSLQVIGVDRRKNSSVDLNKYRKYWIHDLETPEGFFSFEASFEDEQYLAESQHKSVFIGSHFLHCIDNWLDVIQKFNFPWIVIEPSLLSIDEPYGKQLKLFGAEPIVEQDIEEAFLSNSYTLAKKEYSEDQTLWVFLPADFTILGGNNGI